MATGNFGTKDLITKYETRISALYDEGTMLKPEKRRYDKNEGTEMRMIASISRSKDDNIGASIQPARRYNKHEGAEMRMIASISRSKDDNIEGTDMRIETEQEGKVNQEETEMRIETEQGVKINQEGTEMRIETEQEGKVNQEETEIRIETEQGGKVNQEETEIRIETEQGANVNQEGKELRMEACSGSSDAQEGTEMQIRADQEIYEAYALVDIDFTTEEKDELSITQGDIICNINKDTDTEGWWIGYLNGKTGFFPSNFVQEITKQEYTALMRSKGDKKLVCIVKYNHDAEDDDVLNIKVGDVIIAISKTEEYWWEGTLKGERGLFPRNYVKEISVNEYTKMQIDKSHDIEACVVSHTYNSKKGDELNIAIGDVITHIDRVEDYWWEGTLGDERGMFPNNYVQEMAADKAIGAPGASTGDYENDAAFKKTYRNAITVSLPNKGYKVWNSPDDDIIFVGGDTCTMLNIMSENGDEISNIPLKFGNDAHAIISGLSFCTCKLVVVVWYKLPHNKPGYSKAFYILLMPDYSLVVHLEEIDVITPQVVFDFSADSLGIYSRIHQLISIYDKQSLRMKKVIHLEESNNQRSIISGICRTQNGDIFMSDGPNHVVHKYLSSGKYNCSFGRPMALNSHIKAGYLYEPREIFIMNKAVAVACANGHVHIIQCNRWVDVIDLRSPLSGMCLCSEHIVTIKGTVMKMYNSDE